MKIQKNSLWIVCALLMTKSLSVQAGSHLWRINEFYSSPDHKIQFIEMYEIAGSSNERFIGNRWFQTNTYNLDHTELLGQHLTGDTANKKFLVGSASYAALPNVPAPDYIFPDGFLNPHGDTVHWWTYQTIDIPEGVMPFDGIHSITVVDPNVPTYSVGTNSPTNFAGDTGTVVLPTTPSSGDINGDGQLNLGDVQQLLKQILGIGQ